MSPTRPVIVFERRGLALLGAVQAEGDPLRVIAEGGGQVQVPSDRVLRNQTQGVEGGTPKEIGGELRKRRLDCEDRVDLELLWESVPRDAVTPLDEILSIWFGEATDEGALALVRSLEGALPWFTPGAGGLRRNARAAIDEERTRRENEERARALEAAVIDWLNGSPGDAPPSGAEPVLEELRGLALRGGEGAARRAVRIARKVGCPEPDDLLEKLEDGGLVPRHVDVGPMRWGVSVSFPAELESPCDDAVPAADREDLTGLHTIALDDPDTVEVDDALSWEPAEDGILLHVHIADVAARVPPDSPLDEEAARRGRTIYEPDRRIPMLPPGVIEACSLDAGVTRSAVTGTFHVTSEGAVCSVRFRRTLVCVDRRAGFDGAGLDLLGPMGKIAAALRARRVAEGAVCLDLPDVKIVVDDMRPRLKIRRPDSVADHVVAESAVLYNRTAADVLAAAEVACVYRTQPPIGDTIPDLDDPLRVLRARRMFPPAESAVEPARHHGVAADRYLTATSPIRRYVDLVHQRQLLAVLGERMPIYRRDEVEAVLERDAERVRAARMVEGERYSYWLGRYLEERKGRVLSGVVSRTMPGGRVGIWIDEILRELTTRLPRGHASVAEGDPIRVRIARVRPRRGSVHLEVES